jgi:phosphodiesterase/alkaline phosphatase D-like protein
VDPRIELTRENLTVIRWTIDSLGGSPVHYGIVHYGTHPNDLVETAESPVRLNPSHSYTVFRVRMDGLKPETTYYYKVDSREADGARDRIISPLNKFTTH